MEFLNKILTGPLKDFARIFAEFLPNLLSALIVLFLGLVCCKIVKGLTIRAFRVLSADNFFQRTGVSSLLEKGGIKDTPSVFISRIFFWLLFIVFATIALYTLNVPAIEILLQKLLLYLPNFFVAVIIVIAGFLLSNFVETAVLIASVNAGIKFAKLLSHGIKFIIILLASTMAMEQLGIGHDTVLIAFAVVFGGVALALSLAFGLAGKEIALKYLEKKLSGEDDDGSGIKHL